MAFTLESAAEHWNELAAATDAAVAAGIADPLAGGYRADTYRRTARAMRIEIETGVAVCVCCFKPHGDGPSFLPRIRD